MYLCLIPLTFPPYPCIHITLISSFNYSALNIMIVLQKYSQVLKSYS